MTKRRKVKNMNHEEEQKMAIHYNTTSFVNSQTKFFQAHARKQPTLLGMEFEHILIDRDSLRSYDYFEPDGQKAIFEKLLTKGWEPILIEKNHLLGIQKEGDTLTLEPGGQIEISLRPLSDIKEIDFYYHKVIEEVYSVLKENQVIAGIGYHPVTRIRDLSLLPKERYGLMYRYFENNGIFCHNMMKGTAATQVSIDYSNEQDFIKKFRVANYLSPVLASLFDATPFFEGEPVEGGNMRLRIWEETDIKRSKLIPKSLDQLFGFEDYAKHLLNIPPILIYSDGNLIQTENERLDELLEKYPLKPSELEHIQSMVFPDVRLKRYIEIRMPDALPYPYNISVGAVIKGLFYNEENLEKYYALSQKVDDSWVIKLNKWLSSGDDILLTKEEGDCFNQLKQQILVDVILALDPEEARYVKALKTIVDAESSPMAYMRKIYNQSKEAFVDLIDVRRTWAHVGSETNR